jgi:hypothetical protein
VHSHSLQSIDSTQWPITHNVGVWSLFPEYRCNPTTYYTHRRCMVTLSRVSCNPIQLSLAFAVRHSDTHDHPLHISALKICTVKHPYLCMLLFNFTDNCFVQWVKRPDGPYNCTIYLQLTESVHGTHDVHKQQDRCTTFGWTPISETSSCS